MSLVQGGFCEACKVSADEPGVHIQKCSQCRITQYCSRVCQSKMWKAFHKHECRTPEAAASVSLKATARMGDASSDNSSAPDKIYYVRTTRAHIDDICMSGPFLTKRAALPNIGVNFRFSKAGMDFIEEAYRDGLMEDVVHIKAPLDVDAKKFVFVEFLTERNAAVKAAFPCPTYYVHSGCLIEMGGPDRMGIPRMSSIEFKGAFLKFDEARKAAEAEVVYQAKKLPGCRQISEVRNGEYMGAIMHNNAIVRTVAIAWDNGLEDQDRVSWTRSGPAEQY